MSTKILPIRHKDIYEKIIYKTKNFFIDKNLSFYDIYLKVLKNLNLEERRSTLEASFYLFQNNFVELATGEGKTFAIIIAAIAKNLFTKKPVIVVTTNPYLVERDCNFCLKASNDENIKINFIKEDTDINTKIELYKNSDILYITPSILVFDFLRNLTIENESLFFNISFESIIFDEVDSILIDSAMNPHILQNPEYENSIFGETESRIKNLMNRCKIEHLEKFKKNFHYLTDIDNKLVFTEKGWILLEEISKYFTDYSFQIVTFCFISLLKACNFYEINVNYIVKNKEILLIDEISGRIYVDRKLSDGLHTAIECLHGITHSEIKTKSLKINYTEFFNQFNNIAGCSGTIKTVEKELSGYFNQNVKYVKSTKPRIVDERKNTIYRTKIDKIAAIYTSIKKCKEETPTRPILVITATSEDLINITTLIKAMNYEVNTLDATNQYVEAKVISLAGQPNTITICTHIVGRGVDIKLHESIKHYGILLIKTDIYADERIDIQIKGRVGRQGEKGTVETILSFEDNIFEKIKKINQFKSMLYDKNHILLQEIETDLKKTIRQNNYEEIELTLEKSSINLLIGNYLMNLHQFKQRGFLNFPNCLIYQNIKEVIKKIYTSKNIMLQNIKAVYPDKTKIINSDKLYSLIYKKISLFAQEVINCSDETEYLSVFRCLNGSNYYTVYKESFCDSLNRKFKEMLNDIFVNFIFFQI